MTDKSTEHGNEVVNTESLAAKLKAVLNSKELEFLAANQNNVFEALSMQEKPDKAIQEQGQLPATPEAKSEADLEKLIKEHLLWCSYHVFQWFAFSIGRDSVSAEFGSPSKLEAYDTTVVFPGVRNAILGSLSRETEDRIEKHINQLSSDGSNSRKFTNSGVEEVQLGQVFVGKIEGKEQKGLVLLEGSFSTESMGSRRGGRTNNDNEILWQFDSMESASRFVSFFDGAKFTDDSKGVEWNTRVIEKSFEATGVDSRYINAINARLFFGQEVVVVN